MLINTNAQRKLLENARVIAVVGHSDKPHRTSYQIAQFLRDVGYRVYAVNPALDEIDGEKCYASLAEVPEPIDIVDVFRRSEFLPGVIEDAITVGAKSVWAQLGVWHPDADEIAESAGMPLVMDSCIKVEYMRLIR